MCGRTVWPVATPFIAAMLDFPLLDSLCERFAHGLDGRLGEIAVAFGAGARNFGLERLLAGMKDPHEFGFATEVQQHGQREASKLHTVSASLADRIINIDSARSAELVNRQFYVSLRGLGSMRGSIPIAPRACGGPSVGSRKRNSPSRSPDIARLATGIRI